MKPDSCEASFHVDTTECAFMRAQFVSLPSYTVCLGCTSVVIFRVAPASGRAAELEDSTNECGAHRNGDDSDDYCCYISKCYTYCST